MSYTKQTWDTNSYVNPTRMNHIEDGIAAAATAAGTDYSNTSSGLSATNTQGAIDELAQKNSIIYEEQITSLIGTITINNIPFKSKRTPYFIYWCSDYPSNDSGAWLVYRSPIGGQTIAKALNQTNISLSISNTSITLNQTSGNADNGTLYVIDPSL